MSTQPMRHSQPQAQRSGGIILWSRLTTSAQQGWQHLSRLQHSWRRHRPPPIGRLNAHLQRDIGLQPHDWL